MIGDNVRILFSDSKYDLIEKYDCFYIRFIGGSVMPIPCDIRIEDTEKDKILHEQVDMESIVKEYMKRIPWTENEFVKRGYTDFFANEYSMDKQEIDYTIDLLENNKALKIEMYVAIMNESFPNKCWARINNMTAKDIANAKQLSLKDSYMEMIKEISK